MSSEFKFQEMSTSSKRSLAGGKFLCDQRRIRPAKRSVKHFVMSFAAAANLPSEV